MTAPVPVRLTRTVLRSGVWHGHAEGDVPPRITAWHLEQELPGMSISAAAGGGWDIALPVPPAILSDGIQTILFRDEATGDILDSFTVLAGEGLDPDIRSEIGLLRAELDMLKRAFRRHCVESAD